jgi:xylulokinase
MDSSTSAQCAALEESLGGPEAVAAATGSRAYERFTGNQIAKLSAHENFGETERISLVRSAPHSPAHPTYTYTHTHTHTHLPISRASMAVLTVDTASCSSMGATIFAGAYAPIDIADGGGMNLMDIVTKDWHKSACAIAGEGIEGLLGPSPVPAHTVVGPVRSMPTASRQAMLASTASSIVGATALVGAVLTAGA